MIKVLLLFLLFSVPEFLFSQTKYSYAFKGNVQDSATFESKILRVTDVVACKLRFKPEKNEGELIFEIAPYEVKYDADGHVINGQPLEDVKSLLLKEGLELKELNRISY